MIAYFGLRRRAGCCIVCCGGAVEYLNRNKNKDTLFFGNNSKMEKKPLALKEDVSGGALHACTMRNAFG